MPGLHFDITGDNSNFLHKLEESRNGVRSTSKQIEESGMSIEQMFGRMTKAAAAFGAGFSAQQFASQVMKVRGEFQQLEVAFNTMLGSKEKADTLMSQLVRTAAITPFDLQGVANGAKQLLAYGLAAEDVNGTLVRLGDIAAGLSIPLNDLVWLYGTTMTQGRLFTQDLRQFQGRGIPLADELAKQFGVAKDKVGELVTAGKVGFPEVQKAIEAMTNDGGKFGGLMEAQSKTITGQISNIEDAIATMYNNIGKQSEGFINDALSGVFYLVENYETIGKTIFELASVYGMYKAVLISVAAIQKTNSIILRQAILEKKLAAAAGIMLSNSEAVAASRTKILTIAQANLTKAIKSTTAGMLANPYVLAAAAIAGMSFAIYKVVTAETELDKAHKRLSEASSSVEKSLSSEVSRLTLLERKLSETQKGTEEYNSIKKTIVDNYGQYYKGLDGEIERVGNLSTVYGQLVEKMRLSIGQRKFESFFNAEQDNLDKTIAEKLDKSYDVLIKKYGKDKGTELYQHVFDYTIRGNSIPTDVWKQLNVATFNEMGFDNSPVGFAIRSVSSLVTDINSATVASGKALDEFKEKYQITEQDIENILSGKSSGGNDTPAENKTLKQLLIDIDISKLKIKELQDQANKGLISPDNIKEQSDALSKLKAEYELRTGKDYDKLDSELKKTVDERLKAEQQLNKELLNLQFQNRQHEIDQMKEGAEKKLAQIELDYDKEISLIMEKENEWKKAQGGKLTKEQTVEIRTAYVNGWMKKESGTHTVIKEQLEAEQQALNDYLKTYGTFQQQKLAIAQEYEEKIKKAQEESSVNSPQVKLLIKERDVAIQNKETEAIKANIDWATVFGEFGGMFNDMVKPVLEEAKKYVQTDKFKNSDQASQKALIDAINQMEKSLGGAGGLNFKKLGQEVQIYQSSLRELNDAKNEEAEAINKLKKAQEDYEKALKNGTEEEKQVTKDALDAAQQNADVASANVQVQTNIANESQQNLTETATMLKLNMDNVVEGLSKLASGGINSAYQGLLQAGSTMKGAIGEIAKNLKDVPIIGWIVAIIDVFKDGLSNVVGGLLDAIFNAVSGILSDVLSGDLFVTIGKSLRDGIGNILNSISFGGWNSLMDKISGSNAKEVQEAIDRLTDRNEILGNSIDKLTDVMEKEAGSKSISAYKQASEYQKEQNANTLQIAREQARYHGSHRSWQYYMGWTNEQIQWARKNVDKKFSGTDSLWELTPEQMKMLLSNADIYKQISDAGKGGYGNRIMEKLEAYADNAGKLEELTDKINESLMQVSFDGLRDSFLDSLMDMDKDAKSFSEDFSEYMQRALLNFSIGEVIDEDLKKWYDDLAELMKAQNGKLTAKQLEDARIAYDEMVQKAIGLRDELAAATGYDKVSKESTSQSGTSKSFQSMSQDTGNELNGRFTAFQISNEEIKSAMMSMLVYVDIISVSIDSNSRTLIEIRNLMITSNGYLENIADYTKKILDRFGANLNSINKNIEKAL